MIHQERTPDQLPDQFLAVRRQFPAAVEVPEPLLQTPAQRAREHAAADGAAEAPREPAERAQQARGDVVRLGQREVQQVRERVVQRAAREEPVDEHDGNVQRERRLPRRRRRQRQQAEPEEPEAEEPRTPEAAGAADVEGLCGRVSGLVRWVWVWCGKRCWKARGFETGERKDEGVERRESETYADEETAEAEA